jgi:hypothetical protein
MDVAQRILRSRLGGYATAARVDPLINTAKARATFLDSFLTGHACAVCPTWVMPEGLAPDEALRRARAARKAHFTRLAMRSAARRRRAGSR